MGIADKYKGSGEMSIFVKKPGLTTEEKTGKKEPPGEDELRSKQTPRFYSQTPPQRRYDPDDCGGAPAVEDKN